MKKICFVVQRYGLEVNGGAELHCRKIAERMKAFYDITVLTTKAVDYMTWEDEYQTSDEIINGVKVKRFSVQASRDTAAFNEINQKLLAGEIRTLQEEQTWIDQQGPLVPELIQYLENNKETYDVFVFFTYLYYTTVMGIEKVKEKAIVVPDAHDEPFLKMESYKRVFCEPKALLYNTVEEKELVESFFHNEAIRNDVGGIGIEIPTDICKERFWEKYGIEDYIIYVGRIDSGKNCDILFRYFEYYKQRNNNSLKLVLMGKSVIDIPQTEDIINLGFVSEEDKHDGIAGARMLVLPSEFESLSMVVLEAFSLSIPVVVNEKCKVLKGHCLKSNAGLYYSDYFEFEGAINFLIRNNRIRSLMGISGKDYVEKNYQWDALIEKIEILIDFMARDSY